MKHQKVLECNGMRVLAPHCVIWVLLLAAFSSHVLRPRQSHAGQSPSQSIQWPPDANSVLATGASGDLFWAKCNGPLKYCVWQWRNNRVAPWHECVLPKNAFPMGILPNGRLAARIDGEYCAIALESGTVVERWPAQADLYVIFGQTSRDRRYLSVTAYDPRPSLSLDDSIQVGLMSADGRVLDLCSRLTPDYKLKSGTASSAFSVPSEDGKYIGVVNWKNGAAMVDVVNKRVLWTASPDHLPGMRNPDQQNAVTWARIPLEAVDVRALAFAPDAKTVFLGGVIPSDQYGATGCVWRMNTKTGKIIHQWGSDKPRPDEYCRYVNDLCVSPDGQFVAAGTVPTGLVWLISTKDGACRFLQHNAPSVDWLSFSPDSSHLAAFGNGEIDIWRISSVGKD